MNRIQKNTKRCAQHFAFYDCAGMERYLEKQAESGWMFDKFSVFGWGFRRIEPKKIHFSVTYFSKASAYDPAPSEQQLEFRDFCEHTGWKLAACEAQMQVFYNESENPVPIETDPATEVAAIDEYARKHYLPQRRTISLLFLMNFLRPVLSRIDQWTIAQYLGYGFSLLLLYLISVADVIDYHVWHFRALKAAETGERITGFTAHKYIRLIVLTAMLVWILFTIITAGIRTTQIVFCIMGGLILLMAACMGLSAWMKRRMADSQLNSQFNFLITLLLIIFFSVVLIAAVVGIVLRFS